MNKGFFIGVLTSLCFFSFSTLQVFAEFESEPYFELRANDESENYNSETFSYEFEYIPGATLEDKFYLSNASLDKELQVSIFSAEDAYFTESEEKFGLALWTSVENTVSLEPDSVQEVPFKISLPSGEMPVNEISGSIVVRVQEEGVSESQGTQFAVKIKLDPKVSEAPFESLISTLTPVVDGITYGEFLLKIKNEGNTYYRGFHQLDRNGETLDEVEIGLLPGEVFEKKVYLEKKFGKYAIYSSFERNDGEEMSEDLLGSYYLLPHYYYWVALLGFLLLLLIGSYVLYLKKKSKWIPVFLILVIIPALFVKFKYFEPGGKDADNTLVVLSSEEEPTKYLAKTTAYLPESLSLQDLTNYIFRNIYLQNTALIRKNRYLTSQESEDMAFFLNKEAADCENLPDYVKVYSEVIFSENAGVEDAMEAVLPDEDFEDIDCREDDVYEALSVESELYDSRELELSELIFDYDEEGKKYISALEIHNVGENILDLKNFAIRIGYKQLNIKGQILADSYKLLPLKKYLEIEVVELSLIDKNNDNLILESLELDPLMILHDYESYAAMAPKEARIAERLQGFLLQDEDSAKNDSEESDEDSAQEIDEDSAQQTESLEQQADDAKVWVFMIHATPFEKNDIVNSRPEAAFTLTYAENTPVGLYLQFSGAASVDADGDDLKYFWTFTNHQVVEDGEDVKVDSLRGEVVDVLITNKEEIEFELRVVDEFKTTDILKGVFDLEKLFEFSDVSLFALSEDLNSSLLESFEDSRVIFEGVEAGDRKNAFLDGVLVSASKIYVTVGALVSANGDEISADNVNLILNGVKVEGSKVGDSIIFDLTSTVSQMLSAGYDEIVPVIDITFPEETPLGDYSAEVFYTYY